jgi:hypothetical protein
MQATPLARPVKMIGDVRYLETKAGNQSITSIILSVTRHLPKHTGLFFTLAHL